MATNTMRELITMSSISLYEIIGTGVELRGNISLTMVIKTAMDSRTVIQYEALSPDSGTNKNTNTFNRLRHNIGNRMLIMTNDGFLFK